MNCKVDCMSCILSLYFSQQKMFHSRSLTDLKGLLKQRENKNKNIQQLNTDMLSNTSTLITLPDKQYSKITRKHKLQTRQNNGPLSKESTNAGLRPML